DLCLLVRRHLVAQPAHIRDCVDAAAPWVDAHNAPGGEDVAVEAPAHQLELIEAVNLAWAVGANLDGTAHREGLRIDVVERWPTVAEDQAGAVIGQSPALAQIAHRALSLGGEVVDEDLVILPGELIDLVVEDGEALAEHGRTQVRERAHLTREGDRI